MALKSAYTYFLYLCKMAKSTNKTTEKKKRGKYDEKLAVKGSFLDIMQASMKHADKNSAPKKKA